MQIHCWHSFANVTTNGGNANMCGRCDENFKASAIGKALKRAGHDKREPLNHFENFEHGLDKAIGVTANYIASDCHSESCSTE